MAQTGNTTRKLYNLAVTALFASSVLAAIPLAEAQPTATTPTFKVTERDGVTALTKMYGNGHAYVSVTLLASTPACTATVTTACFPSGFPTDERDMLPGGLKIQTSSATPDIVTIDLLETGPNTLTFIGSLGAWANAANLNFVDETGVPVGAATDQVHEDNGNPLFATKIPESTELAAQTMGRARINAAEKIENDIELRLPQWPAAASAALYKLTWIPSADGQLRDFQDEERLLSQDEDGLASGPPFNSALDADDVPILGWQDKVFYTVTDDDLNSRPTAVDSGTIRVWSDSDLVGETRPITETGVDTAEFHTNVGFEPTFSANNGLVFVRHGDKVYAQYVDARDANGASQTPQPIERQFLSLTNANLAFSASNAAGLLVGNAPGGTRNNVTLSLVDPDRDVSIRGEFVEALILDGTTPACEARLHQVGGPTSGATAGVYMATLSFANALAVEPGGTLTTLPGFTAASFPTPPNVPNVPDCATFRGASVIPLGATTTTVRHTITARYADQDLNNQLQQRTATMVWIPATTGDLILGGDDAEKRFAGTIQTATLRLIDPDRDFNPTLTDSVVVKVRSDADPTNGISVTLTEATANSGDFSGSFSFKSITTGSSAGSVLAVADRDRLQAEYQDATNAMGRPEVVRSAEAVWRSARSGVVTADDSQYFYARTADNVNPARPDTYAYILVDDQDQNDPRRQDEIRVLAVPVLPAPGVQRGASVLLKEIGVDSGLFEGILPFTEDANDPQKGRLYIGDYTNPNGDGRRNFRIEYSDPVASSGFPGVLSSSTLQFRRIMDPNVRVVRYEVVETERVDEALGYTRFRHRDVLPMPGQPSGGPSPTRWMVAVYTAPNVNNVVAEIQSTRCQEAIAFTLPDTLTVNPGDSKETLMTGAGGAAGDGRYARIIALTTFEEPVPVSTADPSLPGAGDNCFEDVKDDNGDIVSVGVRRPDTITLRAGTGNEATAVVLASAGASTRLLASDGRVLTSNQFQRGEGTPITVETTAPNDNRHRNARDVTTVTVETFTEPVPRRLRLLETGPDTGVFVASLLPREPANIMSRAPPSVRATFSAGGALVPDATIPGPAGDRCVGGTATTLPATPPPTTIPAGTTCIQLTRTLRDGTESTFAVAATGVTGVTLTSGFVLGPPGAQGACLPGPVSLSLVLPGGAVSRTPPGTSDAVAAGPYTCAEIQSGGPPQAWGEAASERSGVVDVDVILVEGDATFGFDAATAETINPAPARILQDNRLPGAFGDRCDTSSPEFLAEGFRVFAAGVNIPADATIRCVQFTRTSADGQQDTFAFELLGADDAPGGPPDEDDPDSESDGDEDLAFLRLFSSYSGGFSEGFDEDCVGDPDVEIRLPTVVGDTFQDSIPAGTFRCVEFEWDPWDNPANPVNEGNRLVDEDLRIASLGQRRIASITLTGGQVRTPTDRDDRYGGAFGDSCEATGLSLTLLSSSQDAVGATCAQATTTRMDGSSHRLSVPIGGGAILRLASGFVEGPQGRGGTCGPAAATIVAVTVPTAPSQGAIPPDAVPTCAEIIFGGATYAVGLDRRDGTDALVQSDLLRRIPVDVADTVNAELANGLTRNRDGITVSGGRGTASTAWFDADGAEIRVIGDAIGTNARVEVRLTGDDILTRRVAGETFTTNSPVQQTFNLANRYVAGSEHVYATDVDVGATCPTCTSANNTNRVHVQVEVRTLGRAAEPIFDVNVDGRTACTGDITVTGTGGCHGSTVDGTFEYRCGRTTCKSSNPTWTYTFRSAYNPSPPTAPVGGFNFAPFDDNPADTQVRDNRMHDNQYSRPNDGQIRFGFPLCPPQRDDEGNPIFDPATGQPRPCLTPATFKVDYTPAIQFVTIVSTPLTGAGETETVPVTWDPVLQAYRGFVDVETFRTPNNGRVFVSGASTGLTVRFDDPFTGRGVAAATNAADYRAITVQTTWRRGDNAAISFHDADFTQTFTNQVFGAAIPVQVIDSDADRTTQQDHIVVRGSNPANPSAFVDVVLRESLPQSGVFRGYIPVEVTTEDTNNDGLEMPATGGVVVVRYEENAGASGLPAVVSASIPWSPSQTGLLQVFRDVNRVQEACVLVNEACTPPAHGFFQGANARMFVRVTDADRNLNSGTLETISVVLVSDGEPEGETVQLNERAGFPGVFESSAVEFESVKTVGNGKIFARDDGFNQDKVWVRYFDPLNLEGRQAQIEGVRFTWDSTDDGEVSIDFDEYIGVFNEVGSGTRRHAVVAVADGDCNLRPNVVDVIDGTERDNKCGTVNAPDAGFCIRVIQPATPADCDDEDPGVRRPARLVETGANTGVFVGVVSFRTAAGPPLATATAINGLPVTVQNADRVRAHWGDAFTAAGLQASPFFFTDEARWHQKGFGVLSFNATAVTGISDKVMLQLIDADLDKAGANNVHAVNTTVVKVDSNALATPLDVTLTETGINTGIFRKELSISLESSNAANGIIRVQKVDTITASYADATPPGTRTQSLIVNLEDRLPPVTTLTLQDAAIGENGVFLEPVTVSLTATDETGVREIGFLFGSATAFTVYQNPFVLGAGEHVITYRAIDVLGREETPKNQTIEVDVSNPTQVPTGLTAEAIAAGHIQLNWTHVANTVNPFEFHEYAIYRDGLLAHIGNTTANGFVDDNLTDENPHSYRIAVRDKSGRAGPFTPSVTITPDATAPILAGPLVEPSQFDIRFKPAGGLNVSVSVSDLALQSVRASLELPGGEVVDAQALVLQANGRHAATLSLDNLTVPCSCVVEFAATDIAGNEGTLSVDLFVSGPDLVAPQARLDIQGGQLAVGTPLNVVVTDNVAVASVSYRLDGGPTVVVPVPEPTPSVSFVVPAQLLSLGAHSIVVNATDNATDENGTAAPNGASIPLNFEVVVGGGGPGVPASFFLPTRARALANGSVLVEWDVPAEIVGVGGFQVWRATSPFALIGNITDPDARSFLDTSAIPGTVYKYVVTFFTGAPFTALGQVPGYPGNDDAVQASAPVEAGEEGRPTWLWYLLGALAFVAVVVLIAALVASRRGGGRQQAVLEAPPPSPPAVEGAPATEREAWAQTHRLRCPECGHRFEVSGTKPIVTNCPNCGRKGILR